MTADKDTNTAGIKAEGTEIKAEPVKLLENPLPLPKKHEKREMDYKYQIPEEMMKYDIEIADGDDFDI